MKEEMLNSDGSLSSLGFKLVEALRDRVGGDREKTVFGIAACDVVGVLKENGVRFPELALLYRGRG